MSSALPPHTYLMIRKLESNFTLTADEKRALQELPVQTQDVKANQVIVKMGDQPSQSCLLLEGFSCVYKLTLAGKRQIMALHIPGDMPDLQSLHLQVIDINIASISPCKLGYIQHHDLSLLFEHHPRLTAAFWHETLVDASIFREWLLNVGQREGYSRIAHIICELLLRLEAVGLVQNENTFDMPITQAELADATGMTPVHVNRVLQALRNDGLIIMNKKKVTIPDWQKLKEAGEFDSLYLHLEKKVIG
ncbi:Crp/Fnr family transcriptional regulator [Vreelandella maris]|uniref:Crp/Fnr family transcriptional regulator n=1 Tax=Vreelandella maris TaxID=2729617 RepID=A0A7Y6V8P6_9GAMM|nr:Crp/Fnr family transcriptional regulator [Halomonas maris]NVF13636.1 Crp/Fnr family transcriptional regulator [Halomonas maris]